MNDKLFVLRIKVVGGQISFGKQIVKFKKYGVSSENFILSIYCQNPFSNKEQAAISKR